jgi:hypothetical protein
MVVPFDFRIENTKTLRKQVHIVWFVDCPVTMNRKVMSHIVRLLSEKITENDLKLLLC